MCLCILSFMSFLHSLFFSWYFNVSFSHLRWTWTFVTLIIFIHLFVAWECAMVKVLTIWQPDYTHINYFYNLFHHCLLEIVPFIIFFEWKWIIITVVLKVNRFQSHFAWSRFYFWHHQAHSIRKFLIWLYSVYSTTKFIYLLISFINEVLFCWYYFALI